MGFSVQGLGFSMVQNIVVKAFDRKSALVGSRTQNPKPSNLQTLNPKP